MLLCQPVSHTLKEKGKQRKGQGGSVTTKWRTAERNKYSGSARPPAAFPPAREGRPDTKESKEWGPVLALPLLAI